MTHTKQPEALRLAAWLKLNSAGIYRPAAEAAEVLREQHTRIAELERFEFAYKEWSDKTDWVQKTATLRELGKHRADVLRQRIAELEAENSTLRDRIDSMGKPATCKQNLCARIVELEAQLEAIGAGGVTGLRANQNPFQPPPFERSGKAIAQEGER